MTNFIKNERGLLVPFSPHILKRAYAEGEAGTKLGVQGLYRCVVRRRDGSIKQDTGWFSNLILNQGLNRLGTGGGGTRCEIGTGTAAPEVTQAALVSLSAGTTTVQTETMSNSGAPDYFASVTRTFRFALGALNGNFSEVGVGWAAATLFSRALILDGGGAPTTITVLADEQLDVSYQLRFFTSLEDTTGSLVISGTTHDTIVRRADAAVSTPESGVGGGNALGAAVNAIGTGTQDRLIYNGTLGSVTASPSGTAAAGFGTPSQLTYSNNSLLRETTINYGLSEGNLAGGIRSVRFVCSQFGIRFQQQFTPAIDKTNLKTLALTWRVSWARRV